MQDSLLVAGVMTGNSLDAADVTLTAFSRKGAPKDVCFVSLPFPRTLSERLRRLRTHVEQEEGLMRQVAIDKDAGFGAASDAFILHVSDAIDALKREAHKCGVSEIDAIGLHGQTCAHFPPSLAAGSGKKPYSVQIADAAALADLAGTTIIYDFRSDDIAKGGEGAPFAPLHHISLGSTLKAHDVSSALLINSGNTGNITLLHEKTPDKFAVLGWDTGPFSHFPDFLMRSETNLSHDVDGEYGASGKVNADLLCEMYDFSATDSAGVIFYETPAPKSSDPAWYRPPPLLTDKNLPFADRLRTAEYFSAYSVFHSLGHSSVALPSAVLLFGGGWKNPVILSHFKDLIAGNFDKAPVLPKHTAIFHRIRQRLADAGGEPFAQFSDKFGIDGKAMEARIFADAAFHRIIRKPFTRPEVTGCREPTICGLIRFPYGDPTKTSPRLSAWLTDLDKPPAIGRQNEPLKWSRASRKR